MVRRLADQSRAGRQLLVNTTDLYDGKMWVWDLGHESERAVQTGDIDRVHRILLASSGIPGAFPFREVTKPTWRSIDVTRYATITAMWHLFARAEISILTRGGEFEVRVAAVPNDFVPPKEGTFVKVTMNALADPGERMGADTNSSLTNIP